jgi:hypothetical protein
MPTLTDLFCGADGSSTGAVSIPGVRVQIASNHWFSPSKRTFLTAKRSRRSHNTMRQARARAHPDRHNGDRALWNHVEGAIAVLTRAGYVDGTEQAI